MEYTISNKQQGTQVMATYSPFNGQYGIEPANDRALSNQPHQSKQKQSPLGNILMPSKVSSDKADDATKPIKNKNSPHKPHAQANDVSTQLRDSSANTISTSPTTRIVENHSLMDRGASSRLTADAGCLIDSIAAASTAAGPTATTTNSSSSNKNPCSSVSLSHCLLLGALFTSVLNTLLLSFLVKTIQLNDKGILDGKVSWHEQSGSALLELPVQMENKSILLASIRSPSVSLSSSSSSSANDNRPLRFELANKASASQSPDQMRARPFSDGGAITTPAADTDTHSLLKFVSVIDNSLAVNEPERVREEGTGADAQRDNNIIGGVMSTNSYLALNLDTNQLEMGAKNFLLTRQQQPAKDQHETSNANKHDETLSRRRVGEGGEEVATSAVAEPEVVERVILKFDGQRELVELGEEYELRLVPPSASSLICEKLFMSPQITGSLEENLDVQAREGNLSCESGGNMRLVSKSASIKLTTFRELQLEADSMKLMAGKHLYLANSGLRYFDSLEQLRQQLDEQQKRQQVQRQRELKEKHKNKKQRTKSPAATQDKLAGSGSQSTVVVVEGQAEEDRSLNEESTGGLYEEAAEKQQQTQLAVDSDPSRQQLQLPLRAYNLVAGDGLLMAAD